MYRTVIGNPVQFIIETAKDRELGERAISYIKKFNEELHDNDDVTIERLPNLGERVHMSPLLTTEGLGYCCTVNSIETTIDASDTIQYVIYLNVEEEMNLWK